MKALKLWRLFMNPPNSPGYYPLPGLIIFLATLLISVSAHCDDTIIFHIKAGSKDLFQGEVAFIRVYSRDDIKSVSSKYKNNIIDFYLDKEKKYFFAFLAIDLEEAQGEKKLRIIAKNKQGSESIKEFSYTVKKKVFSTQRLKLPKSMVILSKRDLDRHLLEKDAVQKVFDNASHEKLWIKSFERPSRGKISTTFGVKRIINNEPRNPHSGIDFRSPGGTPVPASSDGIVALTGDHFFAGKTVILDHGMGIFTMYFHLSRIAVKKGNAVTGGQIIGRVGATGRATGPHLHWGVRINNQRIDPLSFLKIFGK